MQQQQHHYTKEWHRTYLKEIFPFELIHRFMTCNKTADISPQCRIIRFESFRDNSQTVLESKMHFNRANEGNLKQALIWITPLTIHIGSLLMLHLRPGTIDCTTILTTKRKADSEEEGSGNTVLNHEPSHHRDYVHFLPICKELVFDLDVHEFDRFCDCERHGHKTLCSECWLHIEGAYFIMNFLLTHLFGYNSANLLYVFSGGKGIHCFVNDKRALTLNEEQRIFMYNIMHVGNGKANETDDQTLCEWINNYATPELSLQLERLFESLVIHHRNLFAKSIAFRQWVENKLRRLFPATYSSLTKTSAWIETTTESSVIWNLLKTLEVYDYHAKTLVRPSLFIIYRLYFPIIDNNPLRMTATIKLPFSIHPKTMNISLPVEQSFFEDPQKHASLVTLQSLCASHYNKQPLPSIYSNGIKLLQQWLTYP